MHKKLIVKLPHAVIITIGDELLIGQTIDTNSAWIAQQLNLLGIALLRRVAVADDRSAIITALDEESARADIILITGGLGPTSDDITKPVLCEYFGGKLIMNQQVLDHIHYVFNSRNLPMLESNLQQAMVPDVCTVLSNPRGTAPGMLFERNGKIFVSMPGVPHEMKGIMMEHVLPRLQKFAAGFFIQHRTIITIGQGESFVSERLKNFEQALPSFIRLAYLPGNGLLKLRLTGKNENGNLLLSQITDQFQKLQNILPDIIVAAEDISLEALLGNLLKEKRATLCTAESCTGGYIAHRITSVAGSSAYFKGSIISYANEVKKKLLHVEENILKSAGAVSEAIVTEMIQGALSALQTDYAIAVSGSMGPNGGTPEKPVGTTWIAAGNKNKTITSLHHFRYDRISNIHLTATHAFNLLRKLMVSDEQSRE